jgi:hypothetical protein
MKNLPNPCVRPQNVDGSRTALERYQANCRELSRNWTPAYWRGREEVLGKGTVRAAAARLLRLCNGDPDLAAEWCHCIGDTRDPR